MKKIILLLILILTFSSVLYTQDSSLVNVFRKNFERGNMQVKYKVLLDAINMGIEGMELLFYDAIRYVLDNRDRLDKEDTLARIAYVTVSQIHAMKYREVLDEIWKLFTLTTQTELRVNILIALGDIGGGNPALIKKMNNWLDSQNDIFLTGKIMDLQVIIACVQALGKIGDSSSFVPLFTTMILQYSGLVTSTTEQALDMIKGDMTQLYMSVIMEGRYPEKKQSLLNSIKATKLTDQEKCIIAEFALNFALHSSPANPDDKMTALEIRYIAADLLSKEEWPKATELMIEHFNQAVFDLDTGRVAKSYLIKAIEALGSMKTHEAAKRLTLYLELVNSFTENGRIYDEQIVLAVIYALEHIGDRTASSALLYTRYLDYSKAVQKAAKDAIQELH